MAEKKMIPLGLDDFEMLRNGGFYYVDKTTMIRDLLRSRAEVNLFTRPRRFGKSLNMSMLRCFFEIGTDPTLFDGLAIRQDTDLCEKHLGQYPVVSVSLKGIEGPDFESARQEAVKIINREALRHGELRNSRQLSDWDKESYSLLTTGDMDDITLTESLKSLTMLLKRHYVKKVILLIDDYETPLTKASNAGYYADMGYLIGSMYNQALKSNDSLFFAVQTGCLLVTADNVFSSLNNQLLLPITKVRNAECFGFTDSEVYSLLDYYRFSDKYDTIRKWYGGYLFGNARMYNPFDVVNYLHDLLADSHAQPQNYWINASDNHMVRQLIKDYGCSQLQYEIETLLAGDEVTKSFPENLSYNRMHSVYNLWSLLFTTGSLTLRNKPCGNNYQLVIPNCEMLNFFSGSVMDLLNERLS